MAWWGKLIGGTLGFMMGGPLGALLGGLASAASQRRLRPVDVLVGSRGVDAGRLPRRDASASSRSRVRGVRTSACVEPLHAC